MVKSDGKFVGILCGEETKEYTPRSTSCDVKSLSLPPESILINGIKKSGLCLPLIERMFMFELGIWQFPARGDRMNPDIMGYDSSRLKSIPYTLKCIRDCKRPSVRSRVRAHSLGSLLFTISLSLCSRSLPLLGEYLVIYSVYQTQ
jgi:hypothetical protein